ncbi:DIS3-like exonuclease 1 [Clytia hemisphaerica]|uniref:DIS3-like exonuclease 1 n=1 Tax=Clytia hemisphaerica TaxID=252671 RepID=UPI0034D4AE5A
MNHVHVKVAALKGTGKNQIRCMANDYRKKKGRTKTGRFFANYLKVNKHRPMMEAFIQKGDGKISSSSTSTNNISQVLIYGTAARNRAVDGDSVVVELLPESQWKSRSTSIHQHSESNSSSTNQHNDSDDKMATGRVVGVLQRNLRDYVVSIPEEEINSRSSKVLGIPWDRKIPKIRITTRQKDRLKTERFVVRIGLMGCGISISQRPLRQISWSCGKRRD